MEVPATTADERTRSTAFDSIETFLFPSDAPLHFPHESESQSPNSAIDSLSDLYHHFKQRHDVKQSEAALVGIIRIQSTYHSEAILETLKVLRSHIHKAHISASVEVGEYAFGVFLALKKSCPSSDLTVSALLLCISLYDFSTNAIDNAIKAAAIAEIVRLRAGPLLARATYDILNAACRFKWRPEALECIFRYIETLLRSTTRITRFSAYLGIGFYRYLHRLERVIDEGEFLLRAIAEIYEETACVYFAMLENCCSTNAKKNPARGEVIRAWLTRYYHRKRGKRLVQTLIVPMRIYYK